MTTEMFVVVATSNVRLACNKMLPNHFELPPLSVTLSASYNTTTATMQQQQEEQKHTYIQTGICKPLHTYLINKLC